MNEIFEKIIEKLKNKIFSAELYGDEWNGQMVDNLLCLGDIRDVIENAVTEYNNGWIPCSVEMPEEHDSIFAKYKGTDKWNDAMFEKTSDVVNVTVVDRNGNGTTTYAHTIDGKWTCDLLRINKTYQIIAWQPLPSPYKALDNKELE